ncbi:Outer membrane protein beta-barrel domain-containing protein [Cyclobacterium lianum]|uniref:Outer membrane protein beta-barrel domain-containing protein n=1 Tax=Cyclobacterium lianum TaxID=388280 RepID=A0A1M7KI41_9BACT|nr:porin family protein [Cyclobacterium lianum]SHM65044.1 Outer membrane protein beta-barrel domain-containing protein [Cyclobacterium lianum]
MKTWWILLWIIFLCCCQVSAQTSIGIKAGYTSSSATYRVTLGSFPRSVTGITAPSYSLVIEQFFEKNAGAQIEFQWLTTGYAATDTINIGNETHFDYLKMPILSNFYLGNSGRFHIKLGPHLGYLLEARDLRREVEGELVIPTYGQPADRPRKIMYGLTAGVGLSKLFGKHTLQGEVRYSYEFGRPESQERIFDLNFTQLEFSLAYLFRVIQ